MALGDEQMVWTDWVGKDVVAAANVAPEPSVIEADLIKSMNLLPKIDHTMEQKAGTHR